MLLPARALGRLRTRTPERLLIVPQDIRTADATRADDIYAGYFAFGGRIVNTQGRSPFELPAPNPEWRRALCGFGWLRHLRAADTALARANARALVDDYLAARNRVATLPDADAATTARRIMSWLSQTTLLLEGADAEFYHRFLKGVARDAAQLQQLIDRAAGYRQEIADAARFFSVDANLLYGIAAAESSFLPRDSADGGRGLFQITQVPKTVVEQARKRLGVNTIIVRDHRHNAFVAAATFRHYLAEMKNDLFLGLLAYNIGPANGGLRFIMQQYGATDFTTIQPYLQTLPRDYPIRVLSYALAFRIWQQEGRLLAYEQENNAIRIQRMGIPGLSVD